MGQLRALAGLRWTMVRSRRARRGLVGLLGLLLVLQAAAVVVGQSLPENVRLLHVILLAPTLFLVFLGLTVVAPLIAGGGNELFPEDQLVAFPRDPRTTFAGSLLLAPLNLAWLTQLVVLTGTTAAVAQRGGKVLLALVTTYAYAAAATVLGQALAWGVVGVRQRPAGRKGVRLAGLAAAGAGLALLASGHLMAVLDRAPTRAVIVGAIAGSQGRYGLWAGTTAVLLVVAVGSYLAGTRACGWALRRTSPSGRPELAPVLRRGPRRALLSELTAVDRASVWRSTSLRRGTVVMAVLPGTVAVLAHPSWPSLALLPGLVAAGAGLLFGVNAFCLDGSGAVWVASLPRSEELTLTSKTTVTAQTCLAAVVLAVGVPACRVAHAPTAAEAVALLGSVLGTTLLVTAACIRLSLHRPHKADLRGPRDTPAPPGSMALYSMRLALGTTWAGLGFAGAAASGSTAAAVVVCVAVVAAASRSLLRSHRRWADPAVRAHVVTTVSYG